MHPWLQHLRKSTFLMNALYLMLSTLVVSIAGFLFWVVVAHAYSTTTVGLATTLLSISGLLSLLGLAGFDTTFVRFLPKSDNKNEYINSGFIVVTIISAILAIVVAILLPLIVPSLSVLSGTWSYIGFVFFTIVTSLNVLTNAIFLSFKQAWYIFIINALFSAFKVILPFIFIHGDAMTIFILAGSAQLIGLLLSLAWMKTKFNYKFSLRIHMETLRTIRKFTSLSSVSSILNLLPPTLLPLIVIYYIGPKNAAYYYMAFTIAAALYSIAYASMQSVFAEGSHDEAALRTHVVKAVKLVVVLLAPAAILLALLSSLLLTLFGSNYAQQAGPLLQLFALAALPVAAYSALSAIFKVTKNLRGMVTMNVVYAVVILGVSALTVQYGGLMAVGWAWLIGNVVACGVGMSFLLRTK